MSNNPINNEVRETAAGVYALFSTLNTDNTNTASHSKIAVTTGGSSGGNPRYYLAITSVMGYSMGIDNADGDAWALVNGQTLSANQIIKATAAGEVTMPLQPAFLAYLGTTDSNVTGNGATYTLGSGNALTEVFDQGGDFNVNGTFTAPVTGKYFLSAMVDVIGCTIANIFSIHIVTTARSYIFPHTRAAGSGDQSMPLCVFANMTAGDTATVQVIVQGEAADTDDILGSESYTWFSGYLVC